MPHNTIKRCFYTVSALWKALLTLVSSPAALAFIPAFSLAALWFGGEGALLVVAALIPLLYMVSGGLTARKIHDRADTTTTSGLLAAQP